MRRTRTEGRRRPPKAVSERPTPTTSALRADAPRDGVPSPGSDAFPVVGIGASAGGLEAFRKLLAAMPADTGIAFVLIPHLDPTHESMMVDLLGRDTKMKVVQAADGMTLERNCVYVIPPHAYLSARDGMLRLSQPQVPHGARMPFDVFLNSLGDAYGERAVGVIL
jgi:two-component system CheB/CheR fusion protein